MQDVKLLRRFSADLGITRLKLRELASVLTCRRILAFTSWGPINSEALEALIVHAISEYAPARFSLSVGNLVRLPTGYWLAFKL
jgi:hypothetical protein